MLRMTPKKNDVPVARIAGPFGVRGEVKCDPTDAGRTLVLAGAEFYWEGASVKLTSVRPHKGRLLVRIEGVDDADAAERFRGATLYTSRDRVDVEPGEYLDTDLAGCDVVNATDGRSYGTVDSIAHYPASDMLIVSGVMVPMVSEFIRDVNIPGKRITIAPPAELFPEG